MSEREYPDPDTAVASRVPADLADEIDAGESVRILDVRDRDEVAAWQIEGPSVELAQVPASKFMQADATGSVDELAAEIADETGGDGPLTVVCARGEASAYVAGLLEGAGVEAHNLAEGMNGWARVYRAREIDTAAGASVVQYRRPSSGCLSYLVVSDGDAAVIDPLRAFTDRYVADANARDADLVYAIDTHVHADHVSGVHRLAAETEARAVVPELAGERGLVGAGGDPPDDEPTTDDPETESKTVGPEAGYATVADGDRLDLGAIAIEAIHAPGHTTEHTAFRVGEVLLTGDGLFLDGVPRPDLEAGAEGAEELAATLHRTLTERFAPLPDAMTVAPGHHAPDATPGRSAHVATLGTVRERLSVFGADRDAFVASITDETGPRPANHERIVAVNLGRESVPDEEAFELELGPNNCAATTD